MVPQLSSVKNGELLNEVCSVSYEVKTQADLDNWLKSNFTDVDKLSEKNPNYGILTGKDKTAQRSSCAAWLSFSISFIPSVDDFTTKDKEGKIISVDENSIASLMPIRLAIARTNAEIFAAIAKKLDGKKSLSLQSAIKIIRDSFEENALRYLSTVKSYAMQENGRTFQLILLQKGRFVFQDSGGYLFDANTDGVNLFWHGVPWLSKGKLQGYEYFSTIAEEIL
jgi:hypothetical protein